MSAGFPAWFACLVALAAAQSPPTFDPSRDLEGFEACFSSEFRDLYPLDAYSELLGKELSAAALADAQRRWKADRDAAESKLAALRADPPEMSLWLLRHRLARSQYFSKIAWTEDRSFPGIVILVQKPAKEAVEYTAGIVREYGPWFAKLQDLFETEYAKPLQLERPPKRALWPVAILASETDYRNFLRVHANFGAVVGSACYDLKLGLSVGHTDPFRRGPSSAAARYPVMNAFVRGMLAGYSTAPEGRPGSLWIEEGLASYLAYHEGATPECLGARLLRPATLQTVLALAQDEKLGPILFHPIEDLVSLRSSEDLDKSVLALAQAATLPPPAEKHVLDAFYGESALWMHFLHTGMDGVLRAPLMKYLRWSLSGDADAKVLALAFERKDPAAIDSGFLYWLGEEMRRTMPKANVDATALAAIFNDADGRPRHSAAAVADGAAAPAQPRAPSALGLAATEVESRHGLALLQARSGDLEGALAALRAIPDDPAAAAEKPRIERDVARIGELVKLRDGFLESLVRSGSKWSGEIQGKKVLAAVSKVEGGTVHFGENRQGLGQLPVSALDPLEIAKQATNREQQGNSQPWARFYAYVLAEDGKWEKLLKDPSEEAKLLREDARTWIPGLLRAGKAAAALNVLAQSPAPDDRTSGEAACAAIRSLLAEYRDVPAVQRRMPDLKLLARSAAEASLVDVDPAALLHAKVSPTDDGGVDVVYEFDSPAEAQDFTKQSGYLKSWRKTLALDAGKEETSDWSVQEGRFTGVGAACYRLPLIFLAPMTIRYRLEVGTNPGGGGKQQANFAVGLCDDRKEDNILSVDFGGLTVRDAPNGVDTNLVPSGGYSYAPNREYSFEVRHDGSTVSIWVDGTKTNEAACSTRRGGEVFLWFHTTLPVSIERIEIRGRTDPASARVLRAARAEQKLSELGFP